MRRHRRTTALNICSDTQLTVTVVITATNTQL